jgi:hypothetical protein
VAAAICLAQVFSEEGLPNPDALMRFAPDVIRICQKELGEQADMEMLDALLRALAMIVRGSDLLDTESQTEVLEITMTVWGKRLDGCLLHAVAALFHLLHNEPALIECAPVERLVCEMLAVVDSPEVLFYVFELLQLGFLYMEIPRLTEFHAAVDYSIVCGCLNTDWRVHLVIVKVVAVALERAPWALTEFLSAGLFDRFLDLLPMAIFELKHFLIAVLARAFCTADERCLVAMIEQKYYRAFDDAIAVGDPKILRCVLRALISISRFAPDTASTILHSCPDIDLSDDGKTATLLQALLSLTSVLN